MEADELVPANEFCIHNDVEIAFIYSLNDAGLIEIVSREENTYVPVSQLSHLEKLVRMYHDMDINLEGIETITYLLHRVNDLQRQVLSLTHRLRLYENE